MMTKTICKVLTPSLQISNAVKISKVRVHWYTTSNGFTHITGLQLKWSNNSTETDWSEMIGDGQPGRMPEGVTFASNINTFALDKGDFINEVICVYAPPGGGQDTALNGIKFTTKDGKNSGYYGREFSEGATNSTFSIAHPEGQLYGISGSYDGGSIRTVGFTGNFRTSDIKDD
ncbi:hypothetical protein [Shewanella piezotolerans]|nr:hypothetical protein [Shewanella piezotolerans]